MRNLRRIALPCLKRQVLTSNRAASQTAAEIASDISKQTTTSASGQDLQVFERIHYFDKRNAVDQVSMIYNAGSRYEEFSTAGVTHALRASLCYGRALLTKHSAFIGPFNCVTSREHINFTLAAPSMKWHLADFIFEAADHAMRDFSLLLGPIDDLRNTMKQDYALLLAQPQAHVIELLHKAAYRNGGLGRSLWANPEQTDDMTFEKMTAFAQEYFTLDNLNIVSTGISPEKLDVLATDWQPVTGQKRTPSASVYKGGNARCENNNKVVHAALAWNGYGLDAKEKLAQAVLQHTFGTQPKVHRSPYTSRLAKTAFEATGSPVHATTINIQYSDSGLFGFHVVADWRDVSKALTPIVELAKQPVSDESFERAKKSLLVDLEDRVNSDALVHEKYPALLNRDVQDWEIGQESNTPQLLEETVKSVSKADVQQVAEKIFSSPLSMAAVGRLDHVAYADEI